MSEQNKSLIRRAVEKVWNRRAILGEFITKQQSLVSGA